MMRKLLLVTAIQLGVVSFGAAQESDDSPQRWLVCDAVRFWVDHVQAYQFYITDTFRGPDFQVNANRKEIDDKWFAHMRNLDPHAHANYCVGSVTRERSQQYREEQIKKMGEFSGTDSTVEDPFDGVN